MSRRPRRGRRSTRRPQGGAAGAELASLEYYLARNLFSWIRADYRTEAASKVTAFQDKVALVSEGAVAPNARSIDPAHALSQATSGLQVAAITKDAGFGNHEVAVFTGAQRYASSFTAQWQFMYDGTGGEIWSVCSHSNAITGMYLSWGTSGTAPEIYLSSSQNVNYEVYGGAISATGVPAGTPFLFDGYNIEGGSPEVYCKVTGQTAATGSRTGTSPPAPTAPMTLGATSSGTFALSGKVADIMIANQVSSGLRAKVLRYVQLRYGLAA